MAVRVLRKEVADNLEEVRGSLRKGEKHYRALMNISTGQIRCAKDIHRLEAAFGKQKIERMEDWREILFEAGPNRIEIANFSHSDLSPLAWRIISETCFILSRGEDLSSVHLIEGREKISDLSHWCGVLSRIDAEKRLDKKPVGSYLLREADLIAHRTAFHLSEENQIFVYPYLLTRVEPDEKTVDHLILETPFGWTEYLDDPNLQDKTLYCYHSSLRKYLETNF
jgi:hypothetical protein